MRKHAALMVILPLSACLDANDPAGGGFFQGVSGITSGSYDDRISEREADVADARKENAVLRAEQGNLAARISATKGELASARFELLKQRDRTRNLDADTRQRVNAALVAEPREGTDAQRLVDLQRLLIETRALSEELARLGA